MPFSWGNPLNGRLGNKEIDVDNESETSKFLYDQILGMIEENKPSPLPFVWFALSKANEKLYDMKRREKILMGVNSGKKNATSTNASTLMQTKGMEGLAAIEEQKEEEELKDKGPDIRFPIQKILKENPMAFDEDNLLMQDRTLENNFYRTLEEFHLVLSEKNEQLLNNIYQA